MSKYPATIDAQAIIASVNLNAQSDGEILSLPQVLPSTTRPSMAEGAVQVLAAKDKLYQRYHGVNAATV